MIPTNIPNRQVNIFDAKCTACQLYKACGGGVTAPCSCFQLDEKIEKKKRYDCANCRYICRERYVNKQGVRDSFAIHHYTGRDLNDVQFNQDALYQPLPLIIPSKTYVLPEGFQLNVRWAAIDIEKTLSIFKNPFAHSDDTEWAIAVRKAARVHKNTKLLAVLNGNDNDLERFWGSNRHNVYNTMKMSNVSAVTGPTFSVNDITKDKRNIPESHRVTMLRRHHRVMQELAERDLIPVPNVYCRNEHDVKIWIDWLSKNESIKFLSRDLTCTRQVNAEYNRYVSQLVEIIKGTKRSFHIIFIGPSQSKAANLMEQFSKLGCTCTFVVSDPIISGSKGYGLVYQNAKPPTKEKNIDLYRPKIATKNISVLNDHLLAVASQLPIYKENLIEYSNSSVLHLSEIKHLNKNKA